jgi:hypothetical protein
VTNRTWEFDVEPSLVDRRTVDHITVGSGYAQQPVPQRNVSLTIGDRTAVIAPREMKHFMYLLRYAYTGEDPGERFLKAIT